MQSIRTVKGLGAGATVATRFHADTAKAKRLLLTHLRGFNSDCTRTFAVGEPNEFSREIYDVVLRQARQP